MPEISASNPYAIPRNYKYDRFSEGLKFINDFSLFEGRGEFSQEEVSVIEEKKSSYDTFLSVNAETVDSIVRQIVNERFINGLATFEVSILVTGFPHLINGITRWIKLKPVNFDISFKESVQLRELIRTYLSENSEASGYESSDDIIIDIYNSQLRPPFYIEFNNVGYEQDIKEYPINYEYKVLDTTTDPRNGFSKYLIEITLVVIPEGLTHIGFFIEPRGPYIEAQRFEISLYNFRDTQDPPIVTSYFEPL